MILGTRFEQFAPAIAALPNHAPLTKADLLLPQFRLHQETTRAGLLEIYYSPIDVVNAHAKVVLHWHLSRFRAHAARVSGSRATVCGRE